MTSLDKNSSLDTVSYTLYPFVAVAQPRNTHFLALASSFDLGLTMIPNFRFHFHHVHPYCSTVIIQYSEKVMMAMSGSYLVRAPYVHMRGPWLLPLPKGDSSSHLMVAVDPPIAGVVAGAEEEGAAFVAIVFQVGFLVKPAALSIGVDRLLIGGQAAMVGEEEAPSLKALIPCCGA
nr:hypothetical protein Itr_chr03CG04150 [Ipomoea trifida]